MEAIKEETQIKIDKCNKTIAVFGKFTILAFLLFLLSLDETAPKWVSPLSIFMRGFALIFFVKAFCHFYMAVKSHKPKSLGI
ncbi:MAG: hypothetical protein COU51_01670 [Parcubacteria group bacterium CG10_big_fil_rev_8_21_14_0_10_36_14]|nr:MAG: hypothetical protein COU51_01670 [Parcubacteria group bacterium CG10_big_fil_rev_8_21_14_0_10_36_14]